MTTKNRRTVLAWLVFLGLSLQVVVSALWLGGVPHEARAVLLLLGAGTIVLWAGFVILSRDLIPRWPWVGWWLIFAAALLTVRYCSVEFEYIARLDWLLFLWGATQSLVAADLFKRCPEFPRHWLLVVCALAVIMVVGGLFQLKSPEPSVWGLARPEQYGRRASGFFVNPNHFAAFLGMSSLPAIAALLVGRAGVARSLSVGYAAMMSIIGLVFSYSRGGILAAGIGMVIMGFILLFRPGRRVAGVVLLGLVFSVAGGALLVSKPLRERWVQLGEVVRGNDDTARLKIWDSAVKVFMDYPIYGGGPGSFEFHYFRHRSVHYQASAVRAHSDPLNILADYGIAGGVTIVVLLAGLAARWFAAFRSWVCDSSEDRTRGESGSALAIAAGFGILFLLIHGFVDFLIYIPALLLVAAIWTSILLADGRTLFGKGWSQWTRWMGASGVLGLLGAAVVMAVFGGRLFHERTTLGLAQRDEVEFGTVMRGLERAAEIEPNNDLTWLLLGEYHRRLGALGNPDWDSHLKSAVTHFQTAIRKNPLRYETYLKLGFCYNWLGHEEDAKEAFQQASELDPQGARTMAWMGWHYFQNQDYALAKENLIRSLNHLPANKNPLAKQYLDAVLERVDER